ncbi:predicted protein [Naegleria gruberi]|uniref:Predicted protein n=1 Tax=Naegleria gruberi TaxID=5762 RepID=D2W021_NAEGR|nr:uncharacterized protein NAEGRDRAFT_74701 [Naegleria gruberi]EFC37494.1 predicted protein [Naegleria gruberi]|eukprot:XP_002670238.1 predicted protein [Naegleria gruberi strain NEG-M]
MSQVKTVILLLLIALVSAVAVNASLDTFDMLSDFISMSDLSPRRSSSSSSSSRRPTSSSSYRRPTSSYNRRPTTSNSRRPTSYNRRPTTTTNNRRRPTSNTRRPTSSNNRRQPTNRRPTRPTRTNVRNGSNNNRRKPSNSVRPGMSNQRFSQYRNTQSKPYGANTQSNQPARQPTRQPTTAQQPAQQNIRSTAPSSQVVQSAMSNVRSASHSQSQGKCAKYTANAIEKALTGKTYTINRPGSAKDFGSWLQKMGYQKVSGPMQPGDVQIFQAIPGHPDGHMQMLTSGGQFVSDFRQRDMYPGPSYRNTHQVPANYRYVGNQ